MLLLIYLCVQLFLLFILFPFRSRISESKAMNNFMAFDKFLNFFARGLYYLECSQKCFDARFTLLALDINMTFFLAMLLGE